MVGDAAASCKRATPGLREHHAAMPDDLPGAAPGGDMPWRPIERWRALVRLRRDQFERLRGRTPGRDADDYWRRRVANYYGASRTLGDDRDLVRIVRAACEAAAARSGRPPAAPPTLLDVGGGFGAIAVPIARSGFPVTVVEPSAAMREYLERWVTEEGLRERVAVVPDAWPGASVDLHDVVLCAHVLYPIEDVEAFVGRLLEASRSACLIAMRLRPAELAPDGLFAELHGEPRIPQPAFADLLGVLGELSVRYEATTYDSASTWTFADLDEAEESLSEALVAGDRPDLRARVRAWAAGNLVPEDGRLTPPRRHSLEGVATIRAAPGGSAG
jgi:hypothetical protein